MIELPEARTIGKDLRKKIIGKKIINVIVRQSPHKFTFFHDNPDNYNNLLSNKRITDIVDRNFYVEIIVEDYTIIMRDGANIRYVEDEKLLPKKHQMLIKFEDDTFIVVTVAMYAFIAVFKPYEFKNEYYEKELNGISPLSDKFTLEYFLSLINNYTLKLSAKAFLATEQRILGIGNGVVQDILFNAKINPKRKMNTLNSIELEVLYKAIVDTLNKMINENGRDTESDIFGNSGNYATILSKNTVKKPCPICSSKITKENFLGGSIYYCHNCQPIK